MMKLFVHALPWFASTQELTEPQIPGQEFVTGLVTGFFGNKPEFQTCLHDVETIPGDFKTLVADLKARDFAGAVGEISQIFDAVKTSLLDCKVVGDIAKEIYDEIKS